MSKVTELLAQIRESEMKDFYLLSSKKKGATIFNNFKSYHANVDKASRCKSEDVRERYDIQAEKYFSIASRQLETLNEQEVGDYIHVVLSRLSRAMDNINDSNWLSTRMLFRTIINKLPQNLTEENRKQLGLLLEMYERFDHELEK